jgi:lipoyl(octanoyl) transferase
MASSENTGKPSRAKRPLWVVDLGRQGYERTWNLQKRLVLARLEEWIPDVLLLLEHDPVFTIGKHGRWDNLLPDREVLEARGIPCIPTDRGGDITYHGPGQIVCYPIVRVGGEGRKVKALVQAFEEVLFHTLAQFGIDGRRDEQNPGVWVGQAKIGSIGIAVRHGVSFHGFSLNVDMDLTPFSWIHACGQKNLQLTSLGELLAESVSIRTVKTVVASLFLRRMAYRIALPDPAQREGLAALGLPPPSHLDRCEENVPGWISPRVCPGP